MFPSILRRGKKKVGEGADLLQVGKQRGERKKWCRKGKKEKGLLGKKKGKRGRKRENDSILVSGGSRKRPKDSREEGKE